MVGKFADHTAIASKERLEKQTLYINTITNISQNATIVFKLHENNDISKISGRYGQTLFWLVKYKNKGITSKSVCNTAYRLASYIHHLRHKRFLDIESKLEPHDGGKHARYWLRTDIEIIDIIINGKSLF